MGLIKEELGANLVYYKAENVDLKKKLHAMEERVGRLEGVMVDKDKVKALEAKVEGLEKGFGHLEDSVAKSKEATSGYRFVSEVSGAKYELLEKAANKLRREVADLKKVVSEGDGEGYKKVWNFRKDRIGGDVKGKGKARLDMPGPSSEPEPVCEDSQGEENFGFDDDEGRGQAEIDDGDGDDDNMPGDTEEDEEGEADDDGENGEVIVISDDEEENEEEEEDDDPQDVLDQKIITGNIPLVGVSKRKNEMMDASDEDYRPGNSRRARYQ